MQSLLQSKPKMGRFRSAVITGASSGIGLEIARLLAPRCDHLVLIARRKANLETLAESLSSCKIHILVHDLETPESASALWVSFLKLGLTPDLWINNAGFGLSGEFVSTPLEREEAMIQLNISSLTALTKLAAKVMVSEKRGTILNVASVAAYQPGPGMAVYFASKAYVLSFSQAVHEELRGTGVRCLALCPGNTRSEFHSVAGSDRSKWMHRFSKMTARQVALHAVRQIDSGIGIHVPGLANKILVTLIPFFPVSWVTRISKRVLSLKTD